MAGFKGKDGGAAKAEDEGVYALEALWIAPTPHNKSYKQFIDQQNDVKASDVELASQEGYDSVELLKRYTTQGMATDQGKTSNVNALAILACQRGEPIPQVGITTFRPPYVPVAMGVFAGHTVGNDFMPVRRTAIHDWNEKQGAVFIEAGLWLRARYFPQYPGDTLYDCYVRETEATRNNVALVDVTTLGKIDIQGPDAPEFLNRLYINNWLKLPIGKARYGIMLREDGMVYDDGTTSRLGENHFFMTTTTANAAGVLAHMEQYHQTEWPDLDVVFCSVTEQWTGIAVAGPNSRKLLEKVIDIDISNEAFPFMAVGECLLNNIPARLFRISFSGELAYEVNVPADYGEQAWLDLLEAGKEMGVGVYGTEALGTMRIEKGHVAGSELDGRTTARDLGLEGMANRDKHFIGKHNSERPALLGDGRLQVVGLKSLVPGRNLRIGTHLVDPDKRLDSVSQSQGHITATTYSPQLDCGIALGLLMDGASRHGEQLDIPCSSIPKENSSVPDQNNLPPRVSPLLPRSGDHIVDYRNLRLTERKALSAIQVLSFKGKHDPAADAIGSALGIECSTRPGISNSNEHTQVSWNGPNSWMIVASDEESGRAPGELLKILQDAVGELGAVVDQSHGRCGLRLSGSRARQVMAKNTAIDLHPRAFAPGRCALTSVAHMNATVVQVDDTPTYDLFVIRSMARSFAHAIEHACREFAND
jgi:heterotetrameric sarcosine oxidase gamma subunit